MRTKMNKYQEALDYLKGGNLFGELSNDALGDIEELVDKATPIKPTNQYLIDFGLGNYGKCKRCKNGVNYQQKYCGECGQALDWREEC